MMTIEVLPQTMVVHSLSGEQKLTADIFDLDLFFCGKTDEELSVVVPDDFQIESVKQDSNWAIMRIQGTLDFSLVGILSKISEILANANISIFVNSTYNTDYIMVKKNQLENALDKLQAQGYSICR